MKKTSFVLLLLVPVNVYAGQLGTTLPWISDATAAGDLVLNNDDYVGEFADNPNKFKVNANDMMQSMVDTERVIATTASGDITEYAMLLGGFYYDGDAPPGVNLDSVFQVNLGFGTGDDFVLARDVASGLRFDLSESVSPVIGDVFVFPGDIPLLKMIDHQIDTLVYQGNLTSSGYRSLDFWSRELFMLPLDIPDLPASVRELYSADALAGFAPNDIPFTIRVGPVAIPEPNTALLLIVGLMSLWALRNAKNRDIQCTRNRERKI